MRPDQQRRKLGDVNGAWRETLTITENDKEIIEEWNITKNDVGEITNGSQRKAK
jgi:hypothetical protein